jgi:hypothetical protein
LPSVSIWKLNQQNVTKLTKGKWDNPAFRLIKRENRSRALEPLRFQPKFNAARTVWPRSGGLKGARTHDAAALAKKKAISVTEPAYFIPGSMKWPQARDEDAK